MDRKRHWLLLALALVMAAVPVLACRYSVRDTGFVDFGTPPYRLALAIGALPADVVARYRQAASATLPDSNVEFVLDGSAGGERAPLVLTGVPGRHLDLRAASGLPSDPLGIHTLMESVVTSPLRVRVQEEALQSFAVLMLFEGRDAAANQGVRNTLEAAIAAVERLLPGMPKPVSVPPRLIQVPVAQQAGEAVLMWGLGLDPGPADDPRVAIVYGRGRRLGTPLEGPAITRTGIQERLVMIGQDCECDLDRAWLQGPVIPGRWDRGFQETATRLLGFDPEHPMVRTEVSRIVLRGNGDRSRLRTPTTALALGYSEESVDDLPMDAGGGERFGAPDPDTVPADANASGRRESAEGAVPPATVPAAGALWLLVLGSLILACGFGVWLVRRSHGRL